MVLSNREQRFNQFVDYIRKDGYKRCMDGIGKDYILESLDNASHIAIVGTAVNRELRSGRQSMNFSKIRGFALLQNKPKYLYLDLICGPGTGAVIFKHIDIIAKTLKHKMVRLSAVPEAMLQYYKNQYGFVFSESCTMNKNVKQIADEVFKEVISLKKTQKNLKGELNKTKSMKNKRIIKRATQGIETLVQKQLEKLESLLGNKNIVAKKGCAKTKNCGVNGYTMTKCL
jgi:hypothetical protein